MTVITIVDFEASGLEKESYPIQVAWNIDGSVESWLINPESTPGWSWWSREAELIHGIPRDFLLAHGSDAAEVVAAMCKQLAGRDIYSDAVGFDSFWCRRLFKAAAVDLEGLFQWKDFWFHINCYKPDSMVDSSSHACGQWRQRLRQEAMRNVMLPEHKADNDVRIRMEIYRLAVSGLFRDS